MKKNLTFSSLLIALILMLMSAIPTSAVTIRPNINLDHPVIMADRTETIYVQVDFDVPADYIDVRRNRPDLNIGLVIDRSGSMADRGKMEYAKDAANYVIDQLKPSDRIAIVEYDDRVTVLARSQNVTSKWRLKSKVNELYPRGATNLTGGMMRGVDELIEYYSSRDINRVLLLSDGLANRGVTDMRDIKRLVKQARREGITISTIGLGLDYNEDLMQMIAEYGGGTYYYIESPRQMRDIFEAEMGQIFATAAKDVKARLKRSRHVRDFEIYGYVNDDDRDFASIGNLYAGEKISLVCKLEINPSDAGEIDLGDFEFDYYDVKTNKTVTFKEPLKVKVTNNVSIKERAENKDVRAEALVVEADAFHEKQVRLVEQGRADEAKENIVKYKSTIAAAAPSLNNAFLDAKLEALEMEARQIEEAAEDSDAMKSYVKKNKAAIYNAQKGKRTAYVQQLGDSSVDVKRLQEALKKLGYYNGPLDSKYSEEVEKAVIEFQKASNIKANGVAGPKTLELLDIY